MGNGKRGPIVAGLLRVALALASLWRAPSVLAAPGALDPSFGAGGAVVTTFGWGDDQSSGRVILRQRDGKLVVGGSGWNQEYGFALARYDRTGALDPTFGEGGRVVTLFGHLEYYGHTISGLAEQADGKLVGAGSLDTGGGLEIGVVRWERDGRLDPSFGIAGRVRTTLTASELIAALALQPDGKILVAGTTSGATGYDMLLARYDGDGELDLTFGGVGWVSPDLGTNATARAVLVDPDGRIVIAGHTHGASGHRIALVRYLPDGSADSTFGDGGVVVTAVPAHAEATAIVRLADGRLLVAGYGAGGATDDFVLARFEPDGTLDATFGSGGVVITPLSPSYDQAFGLSVLPDGRAIVAGWSMVPESRFAASRHLADGSLDPTFAGGFVVVDFPGGASAAYGVVAEDDGAIVLAGSASPGPNTSFALARLEADGTLDATFGDGGRVITSLASSVDWPAAIALASDGRILSGGGTSNGVEYGFALTRHDAHGMPDPTFGDGGKVVTVFGDASILTGLAMQDEGTFVASGTVYDDGHGRFALARYRDDGSLDPTFGAGGLVTTEIASGPVSARALLQQRDGKLVVLGSAFDGTSDFAFARYDREGGLDPTFGTGGIVTTNGAGTPYALLEQSDGKLVAVGTAFGSGRQFMSIARHETDGRPDTSFGSTGLLFVGSSSIGEHIFTSVVERLDGRLVGVGANSLFGFTGNGGLDLTFGSTGIVHAPIGHLAALREPDGAIVGAGYSDAVPADGYTTDVALARYRPNGALDPTFGIGGVVRTSLGGSGEAGALTRQDDTKLVVLARSDSDFALARYFTQHCGNGVLDAGETCDDGNVAAGDCCTPACTLEPSGTPCRDAAGVCDAPEVCDGASAMCPAAEVDPCLARCPPAPRACRTAERSRIIRTLPADPRQRRLTWRWTRGASTTLPELGDPIAGTEYALCLYGGTTPALLGEIVVADASRWRSIAGKGWRYEDRAAPLGLTKIVLHASDRDRSKILVTGKGTALPETPSSAGTPLTVQLVNGTSGLCWGATHAGR